MCNKVSEDGNFNGETVLDIHVCEEIFENPRYKDKSLDFVVVLFATGAILEFQDQEESPERQKFGSSRIKFCPMCGLELSKRYG